MALVERGVGGKERRVQHGLRALRDDLIPGVLRMPTPGTVSSVRIPMDHHVFGAVDTVWVGREQGGSILALFRPVDERRPVALLQVGPTDTIEETCALRTVLTPVADSLLEQARMGRLPNPEIGAAVRNPDVVHNVFAVYSRALQDEIDRRNRRTLPR